MSFIGTDKQTGNEIERPRARASSKNANNIYQLHGKMHIYEAAIKKQLHLYSNHSIRLNKIFNTKKVHKTDYFRRKHILIGMAFVRSAFEISIESDANRKLLMRFLNEKSVHMCLISLGIRRSFGSLF